MSRLRFKISMSLDGYTAGPRQSVKDPLGVGGEQLHEWVVQLRVDRLVGCESPVPPPGFRRHAPSPPAARARGRQHVHVRLFEGLGDLRGLALVSTIAAPKVTHFKFAKR